MYYFIFTLTSALLGEAYLMNNSYITLHVYNSPSKGTTGTRLGSSLQQCTFTTTIAFELRRVYERDPTSTNSQPCTFPIVQVNPARKFFLTKISRSSMQESTVDIRSPPATQTRSCSRLHSLFYGPEKFHRIAHALITIHGRPSAAASVFTDAYHVCWSLLADAYAGAIKEHASK